MKKINLYQKYFYTLIKFIFILILIFTSIGLYQATEYDNKYVNRKNFHIDFNLIRTPFLKRVFLKIEEYGNSIFFSEDQLTIYKTNSSLPLFKYQNKNLDNARTDFDSINQADTWFRSNKNSMSQRFSNLDQINDQNVNTLEVAWIYRSQDGQGQIQSNPIIIKNKIITPTPGHNVVALDSKSGNEIWRFKSKSNYPAQRGRVYWNGNSKSQPGIFFSDHSGLYKLDIENGKLDLNFGNKGFVKTKLSKTAPLIIDDNLIISTFAPSIDVYDVNTGKIKWKFYLKENQNKIYLNSYTKLGGCNPWGGISADEKRKIVYITTGNAQPDYFGLRRPGNNKYCNSIIALDLKSKKKLFDFQEISHDVWNKDMASPPILGSVQTQNGLVDVVIGMSKTGNVIVLDRVNGKPIFDTRYRLGEGKSTSNKYFLDLVKPEPLEKSEFLDTDIFDVLKKNSLPKLENTKFGFYVEPSHEYDLLTWTGYGGVPWTGGSFDDENDILYVNSNKIPGILRLIEKNSEKYKLNHFLGEDGYPATKPPWGSLNAIDLKSGKIKWKVPLGEYKELSEKGIPKTGTENYGGALATKGNIVFASGSLDKKIRAYSADNGRILWEYQLPHQSFVSPSSYMRDGIQYLIVIATGGGVLKKKYPNLVSSGDYFIAFKLN